ncbi:DNA-binding protein BIN4 [Gracilariopsis chorda]|uniref:DNA-binding protein BIN4 n=1 Tax=Gracilariopsis chorda TaxID=448386 RepID=A0A2V3INA6_9FLOR|nr:DNA-binding protein BIN4 [Gracilariopsis chorda]|eukprot:PXF43547.1 DNA-binding protein BIN4 [Gracilariopsis chorda]
MSGSDSADGFLSDGSDQIDLLSVSNRLRSLTENGKASTQDPCVSQATPSQPSKKEKEPGWVLNQTQALPDDAEARRRAITSMFDDEDDDDSVIDLISQEPGNSLKPHLEENQKNEAGPTKAPRNHRHSQTPKSTLKLAVAPKLDESLVLLQSNDESLDLSGDLGAVGRAKIHDDDLFLDIKGVVYRAKNQACNTACVVHMADDEARVTSVLGEVLTLHAERNLFTSDEIVINGDLSEELEDTYSSEEAVSRDQLEKGKGKKESRNAVDKVKSTSRPKGSIKKKGWVQGKLR